MEITCKNTTLQHNSTAADLWRHVWSRHVQSPSLPTPIHCRRRGWSSFSCSTAPMPSTLILRNIWTFSLCANVQLTKLPVIKQSFLCHIMKQDGGAWFILLVNGLCKTTFVNAFWQWRISRHWRVCDDYDDTPVVTLTTQLELWLWDFASVLELTKRYPSSVIFPSVMQWSFTFIL